MATLARIAVAALVGFVVLKSQERSAENIYTGVVPSIATVHVDKADGTTAVATAFLALQDGIAVTAWHVVDGATRVVLRFSDGEEFESSGLIDFDSKRDIALLHVRVSGRPLLQLAASDPTIGSRAYVVGSPRALDFTISDGLVSQIQTVAGVKQIQFSCPASPGNSGGPLINTEGKVIGVVSWQVVNGQNLNFATPVGYVTGLDRTLSTVRWQDVKLQNQSMAAEHTNYDISGIRSVFVVAYRTPGHQQNSTPDVFRHVLDELLLYLRSKHVAMNEGPLQSVPHVFQDPQRFSIYSVVSAAEAAGAAAVVVVTVDRPLMSWIKLTIEAYDLSGQRIWIESDSEGGGITSSGKIEKALEVMKKKLALRLGSVALPVREPKRP